MIRIVRSPIDRGEILDAVPDPASGALVMFDGVVRNHARGKQVTHLFYEAYPEMAAREMSRIREEALQRWPLTQAAIVHRIGRMEVGESSVVIAVTSAHRANAFEACRFMIDTLKTTVPIWKKEHYADGECWIEGNADESSSTDDQ